MWSTVPKEAQQEVVDLVITCQSIAAMKRLRELPRWELRDSKETVEWLIQKNFVEKKPAQ